MDQEKGLNEMGQLPDWTSGRRWLIENYENYHTKLVGAINLWSRNEGNYQANMSVWQAMNRVIYLIRHREPVKKIENYEAIIKKWDQFIKESKIPTKDDLLIFSDFLNEALYKLKLVYEEETEKAYMSPYYHGSEY